ncbi:MAG: hypothetical protein IJ111_00970 [Eggerthellaceae bacterium]|nr:hypothetical protein [Eggerthellaceae bacterium]
MAKKKMTPSQAASARRPDDWEPPKTAPTKKKEKAKSEPLDAATDRGISKLMAPFVVLFVLAAIAAPFIVIGVSRFLGWN